jgi:hypothetical protein
MSKAMETLGQFESVAYRSFTKLEYATQFLSGKIRFGNIYKYKKIENEKLRDQTEGEGHVYINGMSYYSMFASNGIYICCFHRNIESAKQANFGSIIVEICNPRSLAEAITKNFVTRKNKFIGGIEGVIIEYDKGKERSKELSNIETARLTYSQKPKEPFHTENEFRFVFISEEDYGETFEVDLGKSLNNCRIITDI